MLIVEDHAAVATPMVAALRLEGFGEVASVPADDLRPGVVVAMVKSFAPDVVLLDLHLGRFGDATGLIPPLVDLGTHVVVLTASTDRALLGACLEAGAAACVEKSRPFDELVGLVRAVAVGDEVMGSDEREAMVTEAATEREDRVRRRAPFRRLTEREAQVLRAVIDGRQAEEIATMQDVSVATVRTHIRSILEKLGVHSQLAAVALARRAGWPPEAG